MKNFLTIAFLFIAGLAFAQPVRTTITDDGVNVTISTPVNSRVIPICDFHWTFVDGQLQMWIEGRNELIPGGRLGNFTVNGATTQASKLSALGAISAQCDTGGGGGLDTLYLPDGTTLVNGDTLPPGGIYGGSGTVPDGLVHAAVNLQTDYSANNSLYIGKFADAANGPYGPGDVGIWMDYWNEGAVGMTNNGFQYDNTINLYDTYSIVRSKKRSSDLRGRIVSSVNQLTAIDLANTQASSPELQISRRTGMFQPNGTGVSTGILENNSGTGYAQLLMQYQTTVNGYTNIGSGGKVYSVGIGRDSALNQGSIGLEGVSSAFGLPTSPAFVVQKATNFPASYFNHIEVDLDNSTGNSIELYDKYKLPNATPSITNNFVFGMKWNGNGTTATPVMDTLYNNNLPDYANNSTGWIDQTFYKGVAVASSTLNTTIGAYPGGCELVTTNDGYNSVHTAFGTSLQAFYAGVSQAANNFSGIQIEPAGDALKIYGNNLGTNYRYTLPRVNPLVTNNATSSMRWTGTGSAVNSSFVVQDEGSASGTTDGSGDLTITCVMPDASYSANVTVTGTTYAHAQVHTKGSTSFKIRFYDAAGVALASTAVTADWQLIDN